MDDTLDGPLVRKAQLVIAANKPPEPPMGLLAAFKPHPIEAARVLSWAGGERNLLSASEDKKNQLNQSRMTIFRLNYPL